MNQTYNVSSVPLVFALNRAVNWTGYSLDGKPPVTIEGNSTIAHLTNGVHNVTVYVNDSFGNIGSQTFNFTVAVPAEPFPTLSVVAVAGVLAALIVVAAAVVYKKHRVSEKV